MPADPHHHLYRDLRPSNVLQTLVGSKQYSIGLDEPRLSDERYMMDPVAAAHHDPKYIWQHRIRLRSRVATISREYLVCPATRHQDPQPTSRANLGRGETKGFLSIATARKIRNMIADWTQSINMGTGWAKKEGMDHGIYLAFATLTLPVKQFHTDNQLKQDLLNPFIKRLKNDFGVINYVWKAEPQKNGNIHFHLLIDRYIDHRLLLSYWDYSLEFLGYITAYAEQTGSLFPPASHIMRVPKDGSVAEYIAKYLSKAPEVRCSLKIVDGQRIKRVSYWTEGRQLDGTILEFEQRPIQGRCWGCSDRLREVKPFSVAVSDRVGKWFDWARENAGLLHKCLDFGDLLIGPVLDSWKEFDGWLFKAFYWFHVDQFRFLYMGQTDRPPDRADTLREILLSCCSKYRAVARSTVDLVTNASQPIQPVPIPSHPRDLNPIQDLPF